MDNLSANPVVTPNQPLIQPSNKNNSVNKKVLILIVIVLLLIVLGLLVFILFGKNSKPTKTADKQATSSAEQKTKAEAKIGYVTALEGLNLREEPSTDAAKILLLPEATQVKILGSDGDWYYIEAQTKGYVAKEFISSQKPDKPSLVVFNEENSPFNFLYHDVYKINYKKIDDNNFEYSFISSDSYGGFHITTETGFVTLGNYALKNYPQGKKTTCAVQFAESRKECEQVETDSGTIYLVLFNTTLYKISYLKTEGGTLADINNIVFYSFYLKETSQ